MIKFCVLLFLVCAAHSLACGGRSANPDACVPEFTRPRNEEIDGNRPTLCHELKREVIRIDDWCSNGNNWKAGAWPGFRMTENTIRCCNSRAFLQAVDNNCCWIYRATFDALIDIGACFVDVCNATRAYFSYNDSSFLLNIGGRNRPISTTARVPEIRSSPSVSGPANSLNVHEALGAIAGPAANALRRRGEIQREIEINRPLPPARAGGR